MKVLVGAVILFLTLVSVYGDRYVVDPTGNRTNFCHRARAVVNGSISLADGLRGMTVKVAIHNNTPAFYMTLSAATGQPVSGFMFELQNQISAQGGFTFEYIQVPQISAGVTFTTRLLQILPHVDIYANNFYSDTSDRRNRGIGFTQPIVDASLVLITVIPETTLNPNMFSFLSPFDHSLWLLLAVVIFFNGFAQWFFHLLLSKDPKVHEETLSQRSASLSRYFYMSLSVFTQTDGLTPEYVIPLVMQMGYAMLVLVVCAAYTANLASALISQQSVPTTLQNIDDANNLGAWICVQAGSTAASVVASYPRIKVYTVPTNLASVQFDYMRSGYCSGSVLPASDWALAEVNSRSNSGCSLQQAGSEIRTIYGAWPYKQDYSKYCTSFVETVLSQIIVSMHASGALEDIWTADLAKSANMKACPVITSTTATAFQLDVYDLAGIFYIYGGCFLISFVLLWAELRNKKTGWKNRLYARLFGGIVPPLPQKS